MVPPWPAGAAPTPAQLRSNLPTPTLDALREEADGAPLWFGRHDAGHAAVAPGRTSMASCFGPPGSGKTSGAIIPSLLVHQGPAIATSTKSDLLPATVAARLLVGPVWSFDPTGTYQPADPRIRPLRWSPLAHARDWDECRVMTTVMVEVTLAGEDRDAVYAHFHDTAAALLGAALHLLALCGERSLRPLGELMANPGELAEQLAARGADLAADAARVVAATGDKEFGSIRSTAWRTMAAYQSRAALAASEAPNSDAPNLLDTNATVYIVATGADMAPVAPIYSAWLEMLLRTREHQALRGRAGAHLLLALDEVANICPLPRLPRIIAEGSGKGIAGLFCFQDLAQAHARWGAGAGELFRTAAPWRVLFPGVTNLDLLNWVSVLAGDAPVEYVIDSFHRHPDDERPNLHQATITREWRPIRSMAQVANPGPGRLVIVAPDAVVSAANQTLAHQDRRFIQAAAEAERAVAAPSHSR